MNGMSPITSFLWGYALSANGAHAAFADRDFGRDRQSLPCGNARFEQVPNKELKSHGRR